MQAQFTYKNNGLLWPMLPQLVMTFFLIFGWFKAITTNAPAISLVFLLAMTIFIILMFNFSFPRSFTLNENGISIHTTLGQTVFVSWTQVQLVQQTGPSCVIKTTADHWSGKIVNKYMAFIPLLAAGDQFARKLREHASH